MTEVQIEHLLASPLHRYEGRPADGPLPQVGEELRDHLEFRAGLGVVGDRYLNKLAHRHASVTIMAAESLDYLAELLDLPAPPSSQATRRNILLRGIDVDALRGSIITLDSGDGPVDFLVNRAANPCAWMNYTLAPGAFAGLRGRGGMRCEPLTDGILRLGPATLELSSP